MKYDEKPNIPPFGYKGRPFDIELFIDPFQLDVFGNPRTKIVLRIEEIGLQTQMFLTNEFFILLTEQKFISIVIMDMYKSLINWLPKLRKKKIEKIMNNIIETNTKTSC